MVVAGWKTNPSFWVMFFFWGGLISEFFGVTLGTLCFFFSFFNFCSIFALVFFSKKVGTLRFWDPNLDHSFFFKKKSHPNKPSRDGFTFSGNMSFFPNQKIPKECVYSFFFVGRVQRFNSKNSSQIIEMSTRRPHPKMAGQKSILRQNGLMISAKSRLGNFYNLPE